MDHVQGPGREQIRRTESFEETHMSAQAKALLEQYRAKHDASEHSMETMQDVMECIFKHSLKNIDVYPSEKESTRFPFTWVSLKDVAEDVFLRKGGARGEAEPHPIRGKIKREYIIGSISANLYAGGPFEWNELPIHELVKRLPRALSDLKAGREPEDYRIYTLGFPTNEYGHVTPEYKVELDKDGLRPLGDLYTDFIKREIPTVTPTNTDLTLAVTGVSLGASIAGLIGAKLLDEGIATQNPKEERPQLTVTMYAPVGVRSMSEGVLREARMVAGFVGEIVTQLSVNPGVKTIVRTMPNVLRTVREKIAPRITPDLEGQTLRKWLSLLSLAKAALRGMEVPKHVKVNSVIGVHDPLINQWISVGKRPQALAERKKRFPLSLTRNVLEGSDKRHREFAIEMPHLVPFYTESEFRRFDAAVRAIDELGQKDSKDS